MEQPLANLSRFKLGLVKTGFQFTRFASGCFDDRKFCSLGSYSFLAGILGNIQKVSDPIDTDVARVLS